MSKLKFYGVLGKNFMLLKSYLEDRHQSVILNDKCANHNIYSDRGRIKHGFHNDQLLFLLYINDIPKNTNKNSKIFIFTDDTIIIITNPTPLTTLREINKVLKLINDWFNANLLSLNISKTYFIQFSTKNISLTNFNIT
jgi:hypothetical protein